MSNCEKYCRFKSDKYREEVPIVIVKKDCQNGHCCEKVTRNLKIIPQKGYQTEFVQGLVEEKKCERARKNHSCPRGFNSNVDGNLQLPKCFKK